MKIPSMRIMAVSAGTVAAMVGVTATTAYASVPASTTTKAVSAPSSSVGSLTSVVTGTFSNADGQGTFKGTFTPQSFSVVNGVLQGSRFVAANGSLSTKCPSKYAPAKKTT